ncbi:MAG: hypothetical protein P8M26_10550 [Gammaproteobacteria bacterium]|nr:hypothetical protein [Gammaproteobacteria bacterium]
MLKPINQFIIRCSSSPWKFALLFAGFFGSLQALLFIGEKFKPYANGAKPFDLQNSLHSDQIFMQLANYSDKAFGLYYVFTTIDYFFPLFAGLFLATIWAYVLRHNLPGWYEYALRRHLFVLLLIPALFDWLENIMLLITIAAFPAELSAAADTAVIMKQTKLAATTVAQITTAVIVIAGIAITIKRKLTG